MTENQEDVLLWAINTYGVEHQYWKSVEELGELIVEIARRQDKRTTNEKIREELADVMIMSEQLRIIVGAKGTDNWIKEKLKRLFLRLRSLSMGDRP